MPKTLDRPRRKAAPNISNPPSSPKVPEPIVTAYAIVRAPIGNNLWQLVTYTIQGKTILNVDKSVEDLREILVAKVPDFIGGLQ